MTTADHIAGHPRDWKVTTGYRVMIKLGWLAVGLALYASTVAIVVDMPAAWWVAAGAAAAALLVAALMPAPVPRELITGSRNRIVTHR